jgi:BASS family bile acid:Na+ symporter
MSLLGGTSHLTLPVLLLALLLFNASLGIQVKISLKRLGYLVTMGAVASVIVPLIFIVVVGFAAAGWHNSNELQNILMGLALVAAMPIAGSSTAWSQDAEGDMGLSLGLVLLSTALAPLTTPVVLHAVGFLTVGDYSDDLHELARGGIGTFLGLFVLLPSLAGVAVRTIFGEIRAASFKNVLKTINMIVLLTLNYSNAAVSLPMVVARPDPDFLVLMLVVVGALCSLCFASGWWLSRLAGTKRAQAVSLTFGLGMSNNGTGLVVASLALADHPMVMLPLIFYNLIQHLVAGGVDYMISHRAILAS